MATVQRQRKEHRGSPERIKEINKELNNLLKARRVS